MVAEKRLYQSWSEKEAGAGLVNMKSGIIAGKRALNALHYEMGQAGFNQVPAFISSGSRGVSVFSGHPVT